MDKFLNLFNVSHWIAPISFFIGVFGAIFTVFTFIKNKRKKTLCYFNNSINIISESFQKVGDVEVYYKSNKIESLTITKFAIWNDGNDTIKSNDQANSDKIHIIGKENTKIYKAELIYSSDTINNIHISNAALFETDNDEIRFDFEYLEPKQGGVIKLTHTGESSDSLIISGTIIGNGKIKKSNDAEAYPKLPFPYTLFFLKSDPNKYVAPIIYGLSLCSFGLIYLLVSLLTINQFDAAIVVILMVISFSYFFFGIISMFKYGLMPKEFVKQFKEG